MNRNFPLSLALFIFIAAPSRASQAPAQTQAYDRDALWKVAQCVNQLASASIASPAAPLKACDTMLVGVSPNRFAALQDYKMFKCSLNAKARENDPASYNYVHLLTIPLNKATGVEDSVKPIGVWDYAWTQAKSYISDESSFALVANPKNHRGQDQLHIHMARLLPGAQAKIAQLQPVYIKNLKPNAANEDPVWEAVKQHSHDSLGSGVIGVTVIYDPGRDEFAVVTAESKPEKDFLVACPDKPDTSPANASH